MKILTDILKERGKYSIKRITVFTAYLFALAYEFTAMIFNLMSKEYVFLGLLSLVGAGLGLTLWAKKKVFNEDQPN